MLAVHLLRFWWLRPQIPDPQYIKNHDPLQSKSFTSELEPYSAPQFDHTEQWTKVPRYYGGNEPVERSIIEIEKALSEGKDMILVEPEIASQVYYHYVSHGWLLQENTIFYGSLGLLVSYLLPKWWPVYVPCTLLSLMHSWLYFRVYKYDRLSEYQAYDDDRHPVSNLITAWVLGQRPDHFQYVLKKQKMVKWEILSETILFLSILSTLHSMKLIEEAVVGRRFMPSVKGPTSLREALTATASASGYFHPPELVPVAPGSFVPSDIPFVSGWFDLPWFNFHPKPMKYDVAAILCLMGGYFAYKTYEHFFGYQDGDEVDELGREWSGNEAARSCTMNQDMDPLWVDIKINDDAFLIDILPDYARKEFQMQEEAEVTRISSQKPYGWVPPGYSENDYGVFT